MAALNLENCVVRLFLADFHKNADICHSFGAILRIGNRTKHIEMNQGNSRDDADYFEFAAKIRALSYFHPKLFLVLIHLLHHSIFSYAFGDTFRQSDYYSIQILFIRPCAWNYFPKIYFHSFKKWKHRTSSCSKILFETLPQTTPSFVNQPLANKPKTTQFCGQNAMQRTSWL